MKLLEKWFDNLKEIREELIKTVSSIEEDELIWEPRPGMKSVKSLLTEIAAGELWLMHFLLNPLEHYTWDHAFKQVKTNNLAIILKELETIRSKTIQHFSRYSEEDLLKEKEMPDHPDQKFSPEEAMRYMIQHEYYHLGQIIYNRWMLGYNPYKEKK